MTGLLPVWMSVTSPRRISTLRRRMSPSPTLRRRMSLSATLRRRMPSSPSLQTWMFSQRSSGMCPAALTG